MADPVDEHEAWRLVLSIEPGLVAHPGFDMPMTSDARGVLDLFVPLRVRERFVVGQLGQSLDGRIATTEGHSHYVTGPEDRRRLHRLRALSQAVVVGAGTVASDDPRLTVRDVDGPNPVRVVLDPSGRSDPGAAVFTDGAAETLWLLADAGAPFADPPDGVRVIRLTAPSGRFDPRDVLAALEARGLHRVLVEGGGVTVSRFLEADALDRLHVSVAPLLIGSGRPSVTLPPVATLAAARRPPARIFPLGADVLFDLDLRAATS